MRFNFNEKGVFHGKTELRHRLQIPVATLDGSAVRHIAAKLSDPSGAPFIQMPDNVPYRRFPVHMNIRRTGQTGIIHKNGVSQHPGKRLLKLRRILQIVAGHTDHTIHSMLHENIILLPLQPDLFFKFADHAAITVFRGLPFDLSEHLKQRSGRVFLNQNPDHLACTSGEPLSGR